MVKTVQCKRFHFYKQSTFVNRACKTNMLLMCPASLEDVVLKTLVYGKSATVNHLNSTQALHGQLNITQQRRLWDGIDWWGMVIYDSLMFSINSLSVLHQRVCALERPITEEHSMLITWQTVESGNATICACMCKCVRACVQASRSSPCASP